MEEKKSITITENGISWEGFKNMYEVLGFVRIHVNPGTIEQMILNSAQQAKEENDK